MKVLINSIVLLILAYGCGFKIVNQSELIDFYISQIEATGDIVITNANSIGIGGIVSIVSCGCCFIGLILLIVGLVTGKPKPQVMMVQPDGTVMAVQGQFVQQTPMSDQVSNQPQQMVAHSQQNVPQETSLEEYSFEQKNDWE